MVCIAVLNGVVYPYLPRNKMNENPLSTEQSEKRRKALQELRDREWPLLELAARVRAALPFSEMKVHSEQRSIHSDEGNTHV